MDATIIATDAGVGFEAGKQTYHEPATIVQDGKPFAVVPSGSTVVDMEAYLPAPLRAKETVNVFDAESLVAYLKDFGGPNSKVFGSVGNTSLAAILDYHGKDAPSWGTHKAILKCQLSDDWKAWVAQSGKAFGQTAFAEFIEEHQWNVADPDSADLQEMVSKLELNKSVVFKSAIKLQDGSVSLEYVESIEDNTKGKIKIPSKLVLGLSPFKFGKPVEVLARLRYRLADGGRITFTYLLDQPDVVLEAAFKAVVDEVAQKSGLSVYLTD